MEESTKANRGNLIKIKNDGSVVTTNDKIKILYGLRLNVDMLGTFGRKDAALAPWWANSNLWVLTTYS